MVKTIYAVTWCLMTYFNVQKKDEFGRIVPGQSKENWRLQHKSGCEIDSLVNEAFQQRK
jgi:hypothetical protein